MTFSSVIFLYYFLPFVLLFYFCLPQKNILLLLVSLFFYAWGETSFVLLLLFSIAANYAFGLLIEKKKKAAYPYPHIFLVLGLIFNLGLIGFFKYGTFIAANINFFLIRAGISSINLEPIHLPLGISFFTFQAMSYLVDVYRGVTPSERNPLTLGLYISMFPQLVAGPIVRYNEIADQLHTRSATREKFADGIRRFSVGLGQKMLIANTLAVPADAIFALSADNLTFGMAWLGIASYTLQIYFDFAGYSNMAIGLGLLFGFRLPENFNYPYISQSITEFWRRWHMSLSGWFRDYLYIPLGGNRRGPVRTYINLVIVFFLCGLWHGADWTFVVWGLFHGVFLVLERFGMVHWIESFWRPLRHLYVVIIIMIGWVFFRADTLSIAIDYFSVMAGLVQGNGITHNLSQHLSREVIIALLVGITGSAPAVPAAQRLLLSFKHKIKNQKDTLPRLVIHATEVFALTAIFVLTAMSLAANTHNPFIYFRF